MYRCPYGLVVDGLRCDSSSGRIFRVLFNSPFVEIQDLLCDFLANKINQDLRVLCTNAMTLLGFCS
jgi:hypothetical protein